MDEQVYLAPEIRLEHRFLQTVTGKVLALDFCPGLSVVALGRDRVFATVAVLKNELGLIAGKTLPQYNLLNIFTTSNLALLRFANIC